MAFDLDDEELKATRKMFGLKEIDEIKDTLINNSNKIGESVMQEVLNEDKSNSAKKCENCICSHCSNLK